MSKQQQEYRRLWRSRTERKIAGVCGGIADYFKIDPIWVRLVFILFFLAGGTAFVIYLILWILVPIEPLN